jgi:signal transduction histidine kinase
LKNWILKYKFYLLSLAFLVVYSISYSVIFFEDNDKLVSNLNSRIQEIEFKTERLAQIKLNELKKNGLRSEWLKQHEDNSYSIHVYKNDSLVYWNSNLLPVSRFSDIHFPNEGINHLQNGWYYTKVKTGNGWTVAVSFLIKSEFAYQNEHLINGFSEALHVPVTAQLLIDKELPMKIFDSKKNYLFSVLPNKKQTPADYQSFILLVLLILVITTFMGAIYQSFLSSKMIYSWIFPTALLLVRFFSLMYSQSFFDNDVSIFSQKFFYINSIFPNFFEYLVNVILILFLSGCLIRYLRAINKKTLLYSTILYFLLIGSYSFWYFILFVSSSLVSKSEIYLLTDQLFSLNVISYLALFSIGILFFSYYIILVNLIDAFERNGFNRGNLARVVFVLSTVFIVSLIIQNSFHIIGIIVPLILTLWLVFTVQKRPIFITNEVNALFILTLSSLFIAFNLTWTNENKMNSERQKLAEELATERQIETEHEYKKTVEKIKSEPFLNRISHSKEGIDLSDFEYSLERKLFNGYWERYEMNFNLFDSNGRSIITKDNLQYKDISLLIRDHCEPSKIDSNIYYVRDYTGQLSYVILQPFLNDDSSKCYLSATLKSKKIPEGIGFPRLLISSKASVLKSLEKYSIAKYHKRKLVSKYGEFGYPSTPFVLPENAVKGYVNYAGYNHYVLKQTQNDAIIISTRIFTILEVITSFSYVFTFFGVVLLPFYFYRNGKSLFRNTISLALKIQLLLVGIVFFSLFAFGWGSGVFVQNQYNEFTNKIINEKLVSLETELKNKIGEMKYLDVYENGNYINFLLTKLSRVFVTDINLYDPEGHLLATSRPKIFNIGLIGEQMNSQAYSQLKIQNKSEFSHQESIGDLSYVSAYLPFFNSEGKLLAFVNLQHFGQQQELENQIQQFLVAIINVFMLLLAISVILAIVMSNWVTKPLRLLQTNLASIRFGKKNQVIVYDKKDEIGVLVEEYNKKLIELEQTADQLAKSERESAWRDMAKQVAHEIKNPLTPMKLSIQQMMRVFEKENPSAKEKIDRLANSLIEQIDGLSKIANEFSNFAKMPAPSLKKVELVEVLKNVISLFENSKVKIHLETYESEIHIEADKDQMIRAINNLLQNAIQAIETKNDGLIDIKLTRDDNNCKIVISDNGIGIPKERQNKIFVPYFTTKSTGTGIGLSITKQIIENHQGKISFTSNEDVGTSFIIEIPV